MFSLLLLELLEVLVIFLKTGFSSFVPSFICDDSIVRLASSMETVGHDTCYR